MLNDVINNIPMKTSWCRPTVLLQKSGVSKLVHEPNLALNLHLKIKFHWNIAMLTCLHIVYGYLCTIKAQCNSCNRRYEDDIYWSGPHNESYPCIITSPWVWVESVFCFWSIDYSKGNGLPLAWLDCVIWQRYHSLGHVTLCKTPLHLSWLQRETLFLDLKKPASIMWTASGERYMVGTQELGTSVLQPQGTEFCQQPWELRCSFFPSAAQPPIWQ